MASSPFNPELPTIRPRRNITIFSSSLSLKKIFPRDSKGFLFSSLPARRHLSLSLSARRNSRRRDFRRHYGTRQFIIARVGLVRELSPARSSRSAPILCSRCHRVKISLRWPVGRAEKRERRKQTRPKFDLLRSDQRFHFHPSSTRNVFQTKRDNFSTFRLFTAGF